MAKIERRSRATAVRSERIGAILAGAIFAEAGSCSGDFAGRGQGGVLHPAINFRATCGTNLVTCPPEFWGNEPLEVHRVVRI